MPKNLLNIESSDDPVPFFTLPIPVLERTCGIKSGSLTELFTLAAQYDDYHAEYLRVIDLAQEKLSSDTLIKINRMKDLLVLVSGPIVKTFYISGDPNIQALSEIVCQIEEGINILDIMPACFGVSMDTEGHVVTGSLTYTVRQGDSLESLAYRFLGSSEHWVDIARFNDIDLSIVGATSPLNLWVGTRLNIPASSGTNVSIKRDPAVLDAPIGLKSLGINFPLTLTSRTRSDGLVELTTLNYVNTVLEGLQTRLETVMASLPDASEFGSYIPLLLGQDYGEMTDRMLESHIVAALKNDPRVKDVLNFSLDRSNDSLQAFFQVTLFNDLTFEQLMLGYTITGN